MTREIPGSLDHGHIPNILNIRFITDWKDLFDHNPDEFIILNFICSQAPSPHDDHSETINSFIIKIDDKVMNLMAYQTTIIKAHRTMSLWYMLQVESNLQQIFLVAIPQ